MMTALKQVYGSGFYRINNTISRDECWKSGLPSVTNCLTGHVSYETADNLHFNAPVVMFARNPVERIPSLYNYIKRRGAKHSAHKHVKSRTVEQFVTDRNIAGINDGMVRYLSGMAVGIQPFDRFVTESDYLKARERLSEMAFVGLTNRFDESIVHMETILEWGSVPSYKKLLVNNKKRQPTKKEESVIVAFNQYDKLLCEDAIEMFWS